MGTRGPVTGPVHGCTVTREAVRVHPTYMMHISDVAVCVFIYMCELGFELLNECSTNFPCCDHHVGQEMQGASLVYCLGLSHFHCSFPYVSLSLFPWHFRSLYLSLFLLSSLLCSSHGLSSTSSLSVVRAVSAALSSSISVSEEFASCDHSSVSS